jgi:hypothetical protein
VVRGFSRLALCLLFQIELSIGWNRYAIERTPTFIKIWFWPRYANNIPSDVLNGASSVNTDNWGSPTANFPNTQCDINGKFGPANIIINLTFCEFSVRGTKAHAARQFISSREADPC